MSAHKNGHTFPCDVKDSKSLFGLKENEVCITEEDEFVLEAPPSAVPVEPEPIFHLPSGLLDFPEEKSRSFFNYMTGETVQVPQTLLTLLEGSSSDEKPIGVIYVEMDDPKDFQLDPKVWEQMVDGGYCSVTGKKGIVKALQLDPTILDPVVPLKQEKVFFLHSSSKK